MFGLPRNFRAASRGHVRQHESDLSRDLSDTGQQRSSIRVRIGRAPSLQILCTNIFPRRSTYVADIIVRSAEFQLSPVRFSRSRVQPKRIRRGRAAIEESRGSHFSQAFASCYCIIADHQSSLEVNDVSGPFNIRSPTLQQFAVYRISRR
jgi:hypothetical protein